MKIGYELRAMLLKAGGLTEQLARARLDAGLKGKELGAAMGWDPAKVSRTEAGQRIPTVAEVEAWINVCGLEGQPAEDLRAEAQSARVQYPRQIREQQIEGMRESLSDASTDVDGVNTQTLLASYQRGYADALRDVRAQVGRLVVPQVPDAIADANAPIANS